MLNSLRVDPTRTLPIAKAFSAAIAHHIDALGKAVKSKILNDVELALGRDVQEILNATKYTFKPKDVQIDEFRNWLESETQDVVFPKYASDQDWWEIYILQSYKKGNRRAVVDIGKLSKKATEEFFPYGSTDFLLKAFGTPVAQARVRLLAGRVLTELKGITDDMARRLLRELTDGLIQGLSPRVVAARMTRIVAIARSRAEVLARTETIRAHAEGQLDGLERLGVTHVGVMVEWSTTGDSAVCPLCNDMAGVVMTIAEARGAIPRHPACRCSFIPANIGEDTRGQIRGASWIREAIRRSIERERGKSSWGMRDRRIAGRRPKSIL